MGNEINDIEVTVEMTVELNGSSKTFKKVSRQNYNKKGGFTGNVIDYYINDIPKRSVTMKILLQKNWFL